MTHLSSYFLASAATSLISAVYSLLRSLIAMALLYGFCFGALKVQNEDDTDCSCMWPSLRRADDLCGSRSRGMSSTRLRCSQGSVAYWWSSPTT